MYIGRLHIIDHDILLDPFCELGSEAPTDQRGFFIYKYLTMTRDTFIFYRSFYEALKDLPEKERLEVYEAIANYSLNFEEVSLSGISNTVFKLIKPQLDANNKRFQNGSKPKAKKKQTKSKIEANNNNNNNKNKNTNIPLWEDFQEYALSKQQNLDPSHLRLKYEAWLENDWSVTRNNKQQPIKNWKSTLLQTIPYLNMVAPKNELRELTKGEAVADLNVPAMLDKLLKDGYTKEQINNYAK